MSRFAIFTIILSVSVITVTADLAVRDYYDVKDGAAQTSVLTGDKVSSVSETAEEPKPVIDPDVFAIEKRVDTPSEARRIPSAIEGSALSEAEDLSGFVKPTPQTSSSLITQPLINESGFTAQLKESFFNGQIFQLLDITKIPVAGINSFELSGETSVIASITEIELSDEIRALQMYILLQNKTKPYIDLSLNETNAYGDRSFYINHAKKPDEAFLVTMIGKRVYAFAYVKSYHPLLKNLIKLLTQ